MLNLELQKGAIMNTKRFTALFSSAMLLFVVSSTFAIDRGANMIDALWIQGASYNGADYIGAHITGETQIQNSGGQWAILAGISAGTLSLDARGDFDAIGVALGVKYYITELSSISALGSYIWNDSDLYNFEVGAATASFKQRLISATKAISPFFRLDTSLQFIEQEESYNVLVITANTGCDFAISDTMAFVFEGGISESDSVSGNGVAREDGWTLRLAMQYYWE